MDASDLSAVADLAGHPLSAADIEAVAAILADMAADIQALRDLVLPDDVEPMLVFRLEPWR
jgi:hypothetical protein